MKDSEDLEINSVLFVWNNLIDLDLRDRWCVRLVGHLMAETVE